MQLNKAKNNKAKNTKARAGPLGGGISYKLISLIKMKVDEVMRTMSHTEQRDSEAPEDRQRDSGSPARLSGRYFIHQW